MKFIINYNNGVKEAVEASELDEVKEMAVNKMGYTQENVSIEDENGNVLAVSRWYGVEPEEDDDVLVQFGSYGFYNNWEDE